MKTVTLQVAKLEEVKRRAQDAFRGKKQGVRISFTTPEMLFRLLTAKRWELIRSMVGAGPLAIREVARRVAMSRPCTVMCTHCSMLAFTKTDGGLIVFPSRLSMLTSCCGRPDCEYARDIDPTFAAQCTAIVSPRGRRRRA
jgi:predicted transcriptional regulator